jgi:UDP-N-acetyl-D-glucosamine dehydrogenase
MKSVPLNPKTIATYDGVVISTDHSSYDYAVIVEAAQLVVDSRNATRRVMRHREKIVLC